MIFFNAKMAARATFSISLMLIFLNTNEAQILNVEKSRIKEDSSNYFVGKIGINFTLHNRDAGEDNPNNFIGLSGNGNIGYMAAKHSYILINYINYTIVQNDPLVQ